MDVFEAIHARRSIRRYRPDRVPRALLQELLFAAVQAPTPPVSGTSPWALCVLEGMERLAAYGDRAKAYAFEHQPAPHAWAWAERPDFKVFWDAPALVLFCARRGNPETPFDCCRAAQNLLLAAHARGLGSCWVGAPLPWLASPGVAAELGLPEGFDPVVAVVLGYPAEQPVGSPRPEPEIRWCETS
ncbi:MAG: nitroreductase family protein [Burkholderiales bacterium]|nr:nitroreductase family protein [Burkholderiales bacterium]